MATRLAPARSAAGYDEDFHAWCLDQAARLRRLAARAPVLDEPLDLENLAAAIEGSGESRFRELRSRDTLLLLHLLKWCHQPGLRGASWRLTIRGQRHAVADLLAESPSLRRRRAAELRAAYRRAREDAVDETGLPLERSPEACPFTVEQVEDLGFWP